MTETLIEVGYLIPVNERRIIRDGAVYAEDGRIIAVGKRDEVLKSVSRPEYRVRVKRGAAIPGLINLHVHLAQALIRGIVPDNITLIPWLRDWVWPLQGVYDEEDGRASAELCILEMLRSGTTCFLEVHIHKRYGFDGIAEAVKESGIRGVLSKSVMDMPGYATEEGIIHPGMIEDRGSLSYFREMHAKWDGAAEGRINVWIGLRTPGACSDELYMEAEELARRLDTGMTMHLAEVREDLDYFRERRTTPAKFLKRFGMLGEKRVYIHCVWLSREDMREFAESGASVAHCPSSNLKLGSGLAPIVEMLETGMNVGLGTDGGPSNDTYDMLREVKLASILQKGRTLNPTSILAWDALEMATINGARALGKEKELGTLEPGKKADITVIGFRRAGLYPITNPLNLIVYAASGQDVTHVIIEGKPIVEEGKVLTLDEKKVLEKAQERMEKVLEKAGKKIE